MEHRRVGLVAVAAIDLAGGDHPQRRRVFLHVADLHAGRVRAQQATVAEVERVVHGARRMVRREVQRLEVVPVVLDFRTVGEFIAKTAEDLGDAFQRATDRMHAAARGIAARQGDVDGLPGQARVQRGIVQRGLARGQSFGDRVAGAVDRLARGLALVARQCAERLELRGDAAALAEQAHAQRFQRVRRCGGGDVGQRQFRQ